MLFQKLWYFSGFKFSMLTTNNATNIFCFNLFKSIENVLKIFCNSFHIHLEKINLVSTFIFQHKINKSITKVSTYYWIAWLYSKIFIIKFLLLIDFLISYGICSTLKLSKYVRYLHIQSYPMSSYWFILIEIYCLYPILCFR